MRKTMNLFLLGGLSLLALAGCSKQGIDQLYSRAAGEEVVFGAVSRSYNPLTKTAYSGETNTVDGKKMERIDWVKGDQFRVYSNVAKHRYLDQKWADYQIMKDPTNNGAESVVTFGVNSDPGLAPVTEATLGSRFVSKNGLVWSEGEQEFYAIYPVSESADGASGTLSAAIPADQNDPETLQYVPVKTEGTTVTKDGATDNLPKYGFMTAYTKATGGSANGGTKDGAVDLAFSPAFTAFEITILADKDETDPITVKSFEMVSADKALVGAYSIKYTAGKASYTCPAAAADNKSISLKFPDNTQITKDKALTFTVFALPQNLSGLSLKFTVADGSDEITRTLPLTYAKAADGHAAGDAITFGACMKHRLLGVAMQNRWVLYAGVTVQELVNVNNDESSTETMIFNF